MAFEGLADKLNNAFKKLKNKGKLNENDVKEAMREVRLALLEADVNYKVAKDFTKTVTERAVGQDVMESLTPAQMVIKIVDEELTALMGGQNERLEFASKPPTVIMMCGLQGSGKTTHSAKLAKMLKEKQNRRPLLVACDIYRPAAIDQLKVVGAKAGVPVFEMGTENPVKIAKKAIAHAKDYGNDIVILDTAGRLHIDEKLMNELKDIKAEVDPDEILLVIDSMTGQDAVNVAKSFNELLESRLLRASLSSSRASAKSSTTSRYSTPTVWQAVFSAWATFSPLLRKPKASSTRRRPRKWLRSSCRTAWTSTT